MLADLGLRAALERHCQETATRSSRNVRLEVDGDVSAGIPDALAITTFRVTQEALSNAVRHTTEGDVTVRLALAGSMLELVVSDAGPGFNAERGRSGGLGLGLVSMRERAESVGGEIEISSTAAGGTHVRFRAPVQTAA